MLLTVKAVFLVCFWMLAQILVLCVLILVLLVIQVLMIVSAVSLEKLSTEMFVETIVVDYSPKKALVLLCVVMVIT